MKKLTSIYRTYFSILAIGMAAALLCVPAGADTLSNTPPAQAPALAFGVSEVVKMHQGGISKDVIISYINNSVLPFHLTADDIIYLKNIGVPQEVTSALISRDGELQREGAAQQQAMAVQQQQQATAAAAAANAAANQGPPPVVLPSTPPPQVAPYPVDSGPTVIAAPPVVYPDYYPYYGYPYYYGPDIIIGGGWGWGWGRGGWGPGWHGGFGGHPGGFGHGGGGHH